MAPFLHPHSNDARRSAYYISKLLSEIPVNMIACSTYAIIVYWTSLLDPDATKFGVFLGTLNTGRWSAPTRRRAEDTRALREALPKLFALSDPLSPARK